MKAIKNGKLIMKDKIVEGKVIIFDHKILDIREEIPTGIEKVIDAKGALVGAGLMDLHIHGSGGSDVMDATHEALQIISETIAKFGVTSYLATTMTMSPQRIQKALIQVRESQSQVIGAKILGVHLEGPFISQTYKGAQNPGYIQKPNYDLIEPFIDLIKIITLAPEEDEAYKFIKEIKLKTDIVLSMGHTAATFKQAVDAIDLGLSHATHTFNGMSAFNHREPGAVGAILTQAVSAEIIADTIHVSPGLYKWFYETKGPDKITLITDSMRAGCMKDGVYDLGGQDVVVANGSARLRSGSLAGSVLTLNRAISNFYENTALALPEVYRLASLTPAKVIGLDHIKGSLEIGKDADVVIWDDDLNAIMTFVEGECVYCQG